MSLEFYKQKLENWFYQLEDSCLIIKAELKIMKKLGKLRWWLIFIDTEPGSLQRKIEISLLNLKKKMRRKMRVIQKLSKNSYAKLREMMNRPIRAGAGAVESSAEGTAMLVKLKGDVSGLVDDTHQFILALHEDTSLFMPPPNTRRGHSRSLQKSRRMSRRGSKTRASSKKKVVIIGGGPCRSISPTNVFSPQNDYKKPTFNSKLRKYMADIERVQKTNLKEITKELNYNTLENWAKLHSQADKHSSLRMKLSSIGRKRRPRSVLNNRKRADFSASSVDLSPDGTERKNSKNAKGLDSGSVLRVSQQLKMDRMQEQLTELSSENLRIKNIISLINEEMLSLRKQNAALQERVKVLESKQEVKGDD